MVIWSVNGSLPLDGILGPQAFKESDFVVKYCAEHASSDNSNTLQDLVASKLISPDFTGMTCDQVKTEKGLKQSHDGLMNELANLD